LLECKNFYDETPLVEFVRAGDTVLFEWLLERYELDLNQKDALGNSLLTVAKNTEAGGLWIFSKNGGRRYPRRVIDMGKQRAESE
jgi:hypothetical protein